ncbi:MAG: TIGR03085 family metal-binding protein [Nocardioidaceae bacterium]
MSGTYLARREREALCDLALELGPDAPTLCGDWTVKDLVTHLLVRERSLLGAPGIVFPPLARLTELSMARLARQDLPALVRQLRGRGLTPMALPAVDRLFNTMEYVVHHEDLRRARASWDPRSLSERDLATIWGALKVTGKGLVRPAGVPVVLRRRDDGATAVLKAGEEPVTLTGDVVELTMFLYGRAQHRDVDLAGPQDAVTRLRHANLGF